MRPRLRQSVVMLGALAATLALGMLLTVGTRRLEDRATAERFDRLADLVSANLRQMVIQHLALLRSTRSYLEAEDGKVTPTEFAAYIADLRLPENYPGIQGIGFAPLVDAADRRLAESTIAEAHGRAVAIRPENGEQRLAPVALLHPLDARNGAAIGYDMYSEPVRRDAMIRALRDGTPQASGPVTLVQEITVDRQTGFLIYLPSRTGLAEMGALRDGGFVYAPFRAGDLFRAVLGALPPLPLTVTARDPGSPAQLLFDNATAPVSPRLAARAVTREVEVAGRRWQLTLTPTAALTGLRDRTATITVGALSLLLLLAVALAMRSLSASLESARKTAAIAERQAADRALLLREMQHRIKNHLARIQAIARQSARGARDLAEFETIFGGRLSAMAKAQDALTREGGDGSDLRGLLQSELAQVLDAGTADEVLAGPDVRLDDRQTQAVGLVIHELVTNAMKYGGGFDRTDGSGAPAEGDRLHLSWRVAEVARERWLELDWIEPAARAPRQGSEDRGGFGSQLIEALVEGDLGGRFTRRFGPEGMAVEIRFPLHGA